MSKRYMDFVPVKTASKKTAVTAGAPRRMNVAEPAKAVSGRSTSVTMATSETYARSEPKVFMPEPTATPRTRMVRRDVSKRVVTEKAPMGQKAMAQQRLISQQRVSASQRTVAQQRLVTQKRTVAQQSVTQHRNAMQRPTVWSSASANGGVNSDEGFVIGAGAKLGEIEDLSPKFVKTDVPKRPLSEGKEREKKSKPTAEEQLTEAKSKKFRGLFRGKSGAVKGNTQSEKTASTEKDTFKTPKSPFINQDKVAKRPLSKNVYQKQIVATDEKSDKAPVTIIAKPEKESKAGLIVTIILTIILGAVAGSIAFLLLPK